MSEGIGAEVGIVARDAARLAAFYCEGLGFEVESVVEFPQGAVTRLRRGSARCKLYQPAGGVTERPAADPWFAHPGIAYAALLVDDAEAEVARARAAGAEVVTEVVAHRPGARYALLRDPEGNVWEILEELRS
ncbi:MAG TPA: VOC family protein [Acidimicrobiales bacterium]|jgi:predicted enzyme related to lactoylglutathione lyase|nr:VOC family protein [Acidimicrobiales bacterium]